MTIQPDDVARLFDKLEELKETVSDHTSQSNLRHQETLQKIVSIEDQIKGAPEKGVEGIRPAQIEMKQTIQKNKDELQKQLDEHGKILIIPLFIKKLPKWAWVAMGFIIINGVADLNSHGLITLIKTLMKI